MLDTIKAFPCPSCGQFINDSMTACKYCFAPLDMEIISTAVEEQVVVNDAFNKANNIRILAWALITTFFLSLIPFIGLLFAIVNFISFLGVPILLLHWVYRYGSLETADASFREAKKFCWTALFIWLGYLAFDIILRILL